MVGEARLTAHGSGGAVVLGWVDGGLAAAGAVMEGVSLAVVACGVFATVESPDPHAVNVAKINSEATRLVSGSARLGSDHTSGTVPSSGPGVGQACRCGLRRHSS